MLIVLKLPIVRRASALKFLSEDATDHAENRPRQHPRTVKRVIGEAHEDLPENTEAKAALMLSHDHKQKATRRASDTQTTLPRCPEVAGQGARASRRPHCHFLCDLDRAFQTFTCWLRSNRSSAD